MPQWAHLLPELLVTIAERLSVSDLAQFRAVCRPWSSSVENFRPKSFSCQFPWLVLIPSTDIPLTIIDLFDENRNFHLPLSPHIPSVPPPIFLGHKDGWLILLPLHCLQPVILNPLTGQTLLLPSLANLSVDRERYRFCKIALSDSPSSSASVAAIIFNNRDEGTVRHIAFARSGDNKWTHLFTGILEKDRYTLFTLQGIEDIVFHDGKFYAVGLSSQLLAFDLSDPCAPPKVSFLARATENDRNLLLVSAASEGLMLFRWDTRRVMKFDFEKDDWVGMEELGDKSLFCDPDQAMLVSASEAVKGNHIYIAEHLYHYRRKRMDLHVGVCELGSDVSESWFPFDMQLDHPLMSAVTWFMPSLA